MLSHQARWSSKPHVEAMRKTGLLREAILLNSMKGYIVVEPTKKQLGDGAVLSDDEADYEVRPEWCLAPKKTVGEARKRLGLLDVP